jgi:hopanoid biosynthesis associated RND transporter like protein HpnN
MTAERNPPGSTRQQPGSPHAKVEEHSLLSRPLELLTTAALRAPTWVVGGAIALTLVSILITMNGLEFKTSRLDLLNAKSSYNQRWLAYLDEFGNRDDAVVVVQSADPTVLRRVIDDLGEQLRSQPRLFQSVMDRTDLSALRGKALHYLPDEELLRLQQQTAQAQQLIPRDSRSADPGWMLEQLNGTLEKVRAVSPEAQQQLNERYAAVATALHLSLLPQQSLPTPRAELATLQQKFSSQYLINKDAQLGFVLCKLKTDPAEATPGQKAITTLRQMVETTRQRHRQAWVGLTGMPIIEHDEMQASQADMLWTGMLSMALVSVLFVAGYGGIRHAILASIVLQLGIAWSFGFVTLAIGHLNILSSAFGVVVIGQGIDFSIHYVASYLKLRRQLYSPADALIATARDVGPGVFTGAVSTAAAFFAAGFTEFTGIAELGIIGGAGILLCVCATAIVLPPLIYLVDHGREEWPVPVILPAARWVRPFSRHPALTVASTLAITLLLTGGFTWVRYDHNLLNLQPAHLESSGIERELFSKLDDSVWFAVSMCETREELAQRKAQFEQLSQVAKTEEIGSLLPKSSYYREQLISEIHHAVSNLPARPASVAIDAARLKREVMRAQALLARDAAYETPLQQQFGAIAQELLSMDDQQLAARLSLASSAIAAQTLVPLRQLYEVSDPTPPNVTDLPRQLSDRFIGKNGRYLIKVYAKGNIWDLDRLGEFVREVESVDPRITGHPIQTFYASQHMQWSYIYSGGYALVAVFVLLLIDFRNLRHTLLAMTPLCLGFLQMCGLIGWLGIPFNPANMIGMPLIMGIGVDEGAHLVHDMRRRRGRFRLDDSTALAVILTSVTTMAGFGTLVLSRHQGLRSMGQVLTLGVGLCLACTVLFLPSLLVMLTGRRRVEEIVENDEHELPAKEWIANEANPPAAEFPAVEISEWQPEVSNPQPEISHRASELVDPEPSEALPVSEERYIEPDQPAAAASTNLQPEIQYFRLEVPGPPPRTISDDTLSLEALRQLLVQRQLAAESVADEAEDALADQVQATLPAEGGDQFSPLLFGPVKTVVPRRRALPRRVDEAPLNAEQIGPVAPGSDPVN